MPDPVTPSVDPPEPARLRIGDREIPVPPHPMSRESRKSRHIKFVITEPDLCVFDPLPAAQWGTSAFAAVLCAAAGFVGFMGIMWVRDGGWAGIIFGIALLAAGFALLAFFCVVIESIVRGKGPLRFTFDRANGKLIIDCRHGLSKDYHVDSTCKLSDIIGIQLLYSGYHHISHTSDHVQMDDQFYTYELNLVLSDAEQSRLHLCTHSDWKWMREVGQKLSDFLRVPVVDQLYHGD
jgi:hypothetical protein